MDESVTTLGLASYALACQRAGESLVQCGGTWWREVRPCFFRSILPFLDVPSGSIGLPRRSAFGGCQYPSRLGSDPPNSILAYVAFGDAQNYSVESLKSKRRTQVRAAQKCFRIGPLPDPAEFKTRARPIYLEFHQRTKYGHLDGRLRKKQFDRWIDAEFGDPGLVPLGAWAGDRLVAVSLSRVVGDAWLYCSFFASNDALHGHVSNLMLHHVRTLAAAADGVTRVFAGMKKGVAGRSVDAFFLHHGAAIVSRPAVLRVNPLARWMLSLLRPDIWARLRGDIEAASGVRNPAR